MFWVRRRDAADSKSTGGPRGALYEYMAFEDARGKGRIFAAAEEDGIAGESWFANTSPWASS